MRARRTTSLVALLALLVAGLPALLNAAPSGAVAVRKPGVPRSVSTTTGPGVGQITVSWRPPASNGGARIKRYILKYSGTKDGDYAVYDRYPATTRQVTMTGIPAGSTLWVRVFARNRKGTGPGSAAIPGTVPLVPSQVTGLDYTPGDESVNLTWDVPDDGGLPIQKYIVLKYQSGVFQPIAEPVGTNYTATGLSPGTEYQFRVLARNQVGDGPPSAVLVATPASGPAGP